MEEVDLSPAAPALVTFAQRGSQLEQPLATREQELHTLQHTVASCTPSTQSSSVAAVPAPEVDSAEVKVEDDTWDDIALADSPKAKPKSLFPVALSNLRAMPPAGCGSSSVGGRPSSLRESESSGGRNTPASACEPTATGGSRMPIVRTMTASVSVDKLRTVSAKVVSTVSATASSAAAAAKPAAERARTSARTIVSEVSILSKAATAAAQAGALAAKDPEAAAAAARRDNYATHGGAGPAASSAEDAEASRESPSGLRVISGGASGGASGTMADGMLPSPSCSTTSSLGVRIGLRPEGIAGAAERPWASALDLGDVELDDFDDPSDAVDVVSPDADDGGDVEAATAALSGSASLAATRPSSGRFLSVAVQSTPPPLPVKAFRLNGFHTDPLGETIDERIMHDQSPRLPMPKAPAPVRAETRPLWETRPLAVRFAQLRASAKEGWQTSAASLRESMHGVLTTRTRRRHLQGQMRSVTAVEGLALLKRGSVATKYSRHGKQRRTRFTLSADERTLSWERKGVSDKQATAQDGAHGKCAALRELIVDSARGSAEWLGQRRSIAIADVLEVLVGQQSAKFVKHRHRTALQKQAPTAAHLSLTLVLVTALRTR